MQPMELDSHKDPPPARDTMRPIELNKCVSEDIAERAHEEIYEIPPGHSSSLRQNGVH
jgi:hypothetical protein